MVHRRSAQRRSHFDRLTVLRVGIFLFAGAIVVRLFSLQVVSHNFYIALAEGQHGVTEKLLPKRGEIFVRERPGSDELLPVAVNRELRLVYAVPREVQDPETTAKKLVELLGGDEVAYFDRLNRPQDGYEPLQHQVALALADEIEKLGIPGVHTSPEMTRSYPFAESMSQLTGFLGFQDDQRVGQYGLEGYFESALAGEPGLLQAEGDGFGRLIAVGDQALKEARDGESLILTIDPTIQHTVCTKLAAAVQKHGADSGSVVILNPSTGAIIALCNAPSFDANRYSLTSEISDYGNRTIADQYEPGSVMKTITLAAAIDEGLITPESEYEDTGSVEIGRYTIRNSESKKYGKQTMAQVLEQSINTGAIHVVRLLGPDRFREAMERFGFGSKAGIELQGEAVGDISTLSRDGEIWSATASFGQGVTTTALQLAMAYGVIANDGILMRPYLVESVRKPNGYEEVTEPHEVRRVLTSKTATTMKAMLVNVIRNGHGQRAAVPGYYIGGKTGTAQIPLSDRAGYDPSKHIGTFVGFGPLTHPQFAMAVRIDVPRDVRFAESSAAPLFGELAAFLLHYYRVPPDDTSNE